MISLNYQDYIHRSNHSGRNRVHIKKKKIIYMTKLTHSSFQSKSKKKKK